MTLGLAIRQFMMDETGAASAEFVVVVGGSMLMGYTVVTDISRGAINLADNITVALEDIAEVHLMMNDSPNNMPAETSLGTVSTSSSSTIGNPGNDKDSGTAGEDPNDSGEWGTGSNGMSN